MGGKYVYNNFIILIMLLTIYSSFQINDIEAILIANEQINDREL